MTIDSVYKTVIKRFTNSYTFFFISLLHHYDLKASVCIYVTVNLYNQVICILPDFFS